jgi:hypothetical protein
MTGTPLSAVPWFVPQVDCMRRQPLVIAADDKRA